MEQASVLCASPATDSLRNMRFNRPRSDAQQQVGENPPDVLRDLLFDPSQCVSNPQAWPAHRGSNFRQSLILSLGNEHDAKSH
jgi:hypothetical protein